MKIFTVVLFLFHFVLFANGQATVGLLEADNTQTFPGYTLLANVNNDSIFLINNCGESVHTWQSTGIPGAVTYLLENGNILRAERVPNDFPAGGNGGRIIMMDWDSNILWDYDYVAEDYVQHHDVEYLPNGNVLLIAWEKRTNEALYALGRIDNTVDDVLWLPRLVEVEPVGLTGGNIVWQWTAFDHLSQNTSPDLPGFGVADHPELLDINLNADAGGATDPDWVHLNSINYNPELDQIIVSARSFSEIYVIDHSTTTEEAAGHTGGNSGKGGDFLYRWGNPQNYGRGSEFDQKLFVQHDAHWIPEGLTDAGKIMIFNNGIGRPTSNYSSVDIIEPPLDTEGNYLLPDAEAYDPEAPAWSYGNPDNEFFISAILSGAQRLPNGNTLVCAGRPGQIFEINPDHEKIWEYINPVSNNGFITQGENPANNQLFRAYRYPLDYPAFIGREFDEPTLLEIDPLPVACTLTDTEETADELSFKFYPNPFANELTVQAGSQIIETIEIYDTAGRLVFSEKPQAQQITINPDLSNGLYFLKVRTSEGVMLTMKVTKTH